ncbi:MAG: hypothetical protein VX438_00770 [Planctomycetota bacterium]|nr:hypothetical protein [Planctomycetota bacterium]
MKRKKIEEEDVSLDSLLDTMTNVVAILVILLIVTQLGVSDAVKRIAAANPVDAELADKTKKSNQRKRNRLDTLRALAESSPESPDAIGLQLKDVQSEIAAVQKKIKILEDDNKSLILLAASEKEQKAKQEDLKKLHEQIQQKLADIQKLNAQLEQIPLRSGKPAKIVNLPNPRPAPKGAKPFLMLVKNQKIFPLNLQRFREMAELKAIQIIAKARLDRNPVEGIDAKKFLALFNKQKLRDVFFEVTMRASGSTPVLVFHPIERKGVTRKRVTNKSDPFWKEISATNPAKYYISFLVWPESYESYMVTRQACNSVGLSAGWAPQNTKRPFEQNLGGKLRFGPRPKPSPKPIANKKAVNPQVPAKKPLPVDTID